MEFPRPVFTTDEMVRPIEEEPPILPPWMTTTFVVLFAGVGVYTIYYYVKKWRDSKKNKYVKVIKGRTDIAARPSPPADLSSYEMFKAEYPDEMSNLHEMVEHQKRIYTMLRPNYNQQDLKTARFIYDFTEPFNKKDAPFTENKHGILWNVDLPEADLRDSAFTRDLAEEMYNELVAREIIEPGANRRIEVGVGVGSDNVYLLVYSQPRLLNTGKRKPFTTRELLYIVSLNSPLNIDDETPDRRLVYNLSDLGISRRDKDFLARILSAEMDVWDKSGKCHRRHSSQGILCDLERLSVLQIALNRLNAYKRSHGSADYGELVRRWNNSDAFRNFYENAESKGYQSNREFIDAALYFPNVALGSTSFIHPWGYSVRPDLNYARWVRHENEGGTLNKYPLQIGYGVFGGG